MAERALPEVPRVFWEDITDIDELLRQGRLRSAAKLMYCCIETCVWLSSGAEVGETTKDMYTCFVDSVLRPADHGFDLSGDDLWWARNGALHTAARVGQRPSRTGRPINWTFDRSCRNCGHAMLWPSIRDVTPSTSVDLGKFWGHARIAMLHHVAEQVRSDRQEVDQKLSSQAEYIDISKTPKDGYSPAQATDCQNGKPISETGPIFTRTRPPYVSLKDLPPEPE